MGRLVAANDIVHFVGHWSLLNAAAYREARRLGKPYVTCPAGSLQIRGRSRVLKALYQRCVGRSMVLGAALHVAIATNEIPPFERCGVRAAAIAVIPNGVRPEAYVARDDVAFRRKFQLAGDPYLLFVGRLNPIKGPDLLLEAFARLARRFPHHHLVMAGADDGMGPRLHELSERLGIGDRVKFVGFLRGDDKSMAYHAAELLVIPSRQEAMSIVVLEAGACGRPVVFTDRCGLEELHEQGAGIMIPASVEGLERGLATALADGDELRRHMGECLRQLVTRRYTWDAITNQLVNQLRRVLAAWPAWSASS